MEISAWPSRPKLESGDSRARDELVQLLRQMPGLRRYLRDELPTVYPVAAEGAIAEADLPDEVFPPACPFSLEQILKTDSFPE